MRVLITGGLGFIGSHTCVALCEAGHDVAVIDNLSNSKPSVVDGIQEITGKTVTFFCGDIRNDDDLDRAFLGLNGPIDAVMHFAGLKSVYGSLSSPLYYYDVNVVGSIRLFEAMKRHLCDRIIFSSSASVYDHSSSSPAVESDIPNPRTPYGRTKIVVENLLRDCSYSSRNLRVALLRYFNPAGAHTSGFIGENQNEIYNNIFTAIMKAAIGKGDSLRVFGSDYPTRDGTCIRDYIHVMDIAEGHIAALESIDRFTYPAVINLGTGIGFSIIEVIKMVSSVIGRDIPYVLSERRPGDAAEVYADVSLARSMIGWESKRDLRTICEDAWRWNQLLSLGSVDTSF